jgi:hypothetical protein
MLCRALAGVTDRERMETIPQQPSRAAGRLAFLAGAGSPLLLAASLRWAHHWNVFTLLLVAAWAMAMLATPPLSIRALRRRSATGFAKWGLTLNVLCWLGIAVAALLIAEFNADIPSCGGG